MEKEKIIIDRNEAFKHNSCKKLAQLGKVIFTLTANEIDKEDEKQQIQTDYENQIAALFEKHTKQAEEIHTNLVRFRKSCIDKSCSEYGSFYKQLKAEYAELISTQTQKLQSVIADLKKAKEQLQEVEKDTNSHSKEVASSADAMMNDIKAKNDNNQRKEITEATKEITEKTEALLGEFERRLKSMKATHNNESKRIKTEISRLFRGAVAKRKDELTALYKKAFSMKSEIGSIRKEYNNIIVQHQKNSRKLIENRANILNGIKRGCHDLKKQKENLALQEAKNAKTRQNDLNELNRLWKNMKASKNAEIEKLEQKIIEKRNQINKLEGRSTSNSKSRNSALNSITEGIIRDFEEEMQKKKTELEQLSTEINDIHQENEDLMKWTEKAISDYNERINNKLIAFKYKSEQNNTNRTSNFEEEKGNLILQLDEKIDSLKQAVNEQKILNENQNINEKTSIEKSQNELNELTEKHETEFRNKKEKIDKDIEEYRNGTISRQSQRVNEIEMAKSRRQKDRQKKLDELLEKNKNEINAKVEQIQKEKKEKVDELFKKAEDNSSQVQETTNFKQKKAKLESMHQFIVKQINDKKKEIEKAAAKYQTDLAAIDKLKRQLQRRIEAETRVIDDEYEMKIQVAQVDLQKAIENISKLYDEDENQRGREVIEAIRKVRETKNKNSDFISKKNKELADLRIKNQDEEADLKTNLERIQAGDREFQLKKEIEAFQKKTEEIIQEIETESRTQIQAANDSLTKMLNDHENSKKKLEESLNKDDQDFTEKSKQIESEMKEIERIKEEKIAKIASEYNAKEEEIAKKHGVEVERMRKRIEQAKSRLEEAQDDSKKQYENQLNEWGKGTEERHQKSWLSIMSEVKEANKKTEMLEKKIENLYVQQAKIERVIFDPPQRPEEQQKIAELQTEVSSKTAEIQLKFEYLYNLFEQGPDPNLVQAAKSTRSGLLKSAKSRGLVKTLSNSPNLQSLPPLEGM